MNKIDSKTFWATSYCTPAVWFLFLIVSAFSFKFSNIFICLFCIGLTFSNLTGYIKCEKNHKQKVGKFIYTQAIDKLSPE